MKDRAKTYLPLFIGFLILIASALSIILPSPGLKQDPDKRYNVIIIIADALRYDTLGCYGGGAHTPHIDWLAANGTVFEKAYSTASCTTPASISIFTGNYSTSYGVVPLKRPVEEEELGFIFHVPDTERLLSESMKELGYTLRMSFENKSALRANNLQGFEELPKKFDLTDDQIARIEKRTGIRIINWNKNRFLSSKYEECYGMLDFLLHQKNTDSFLLVKWFLDPHAPYNPPKKFMKQKALNPSKLAREETYYTSRSAYKLDEMSEHELAYLKFLYKAEVESIDERVGYILEALKDRKIIEKTYIIFASDHGEMFGEHGRLNHGGIYYEELVHIPLIMSGPEIKPGTRVRAYVSLLDLMPTLKDLLGIKYSDEMQGKSFIAALYGKAIEDRTLYFDQTDIQIKPNANGEVYAILMEDHKLITRQRKDRMDYFLFDLINDPGESENIFFEKKNLADRMLKRMFRIKRKNEKKRRLGIAQIKMEFGKELSEEGNEELKALGYIK